MAFTVCILHFTPSKCIYAIISSMCDLFYGTIYLYINISSKFALAWKRINSRLDFTFYMNVFVFVLSNVHFKILGAITLERCPLDGPRHNIGKPPHGLQFRYALANPEMPYPMTIEATTVTRIWSDYRIFKIIISALILVTLYF